jgi:hypothetical protein
MPVKLYPCRSLDGFVKNPEAALRFISRHYGVRQSTPHSSGFARLACGLFTKPSYFLEFLFSVMILSFHGSCKDDIDPPKGNAR